MNASPDATDAFDDRQRFDRLEDCFAHVWMVRTFIRHSEEAEEDDELLEVQRTLYDAMHSLGQFSDAGNVPGYLKQARKKLRRLRDATAHFSKIQPQISSHTSFRMAERSLRTAIEQIERLLSSTMRTGVPDLNEDSGSGVGGGPQADSDETEKRDSSES